MGAPKQEALPRDTCVNILLSEYRALYDLALFRLASLDRRVPLAGSALAASLGAAWLLPLAAKLFILIAHPLALVWFLRTTINHARSFEDALRRIEQIENQLNRIADQKLVYFQSRHPSRGQTTGGRTGRETIVAVLTTCGLILMGCAWLAMTLVGIEVQTRGMLMMYFGFVAVYLAQTALNLQQYEYRVDPNDS